ncbi:uncharacterized protein BX663DRAFT_553814 [Cokeromyces recurvatus]|uniref:uncharacterized protein n=1 Tax=Cokeromyces recurvatus TaxID=90255 RepID=UPI00221E4A33|nr:uncharacterized protein BX663DRAFT_553814 [Cokeromyces recurvatus]KAI7900837.1 hypothetical protein BX663DRAFT_553814 [Cokeromyces recurvatus]
MNSSPNNSRKSEFNNSLLDQLSVAFSSQTTLADNKNTSRLNNNRRSTTPPPPPPPATPLRKRSSGNINSSFYYRSSPDIERRRDSGGINYSNIVSAFNEYQQQKCTQNSNDVEPLLVTFRKGEPSPSSTASLPAATTASPISDKLAISNTNHRGRIAKRTSPAALSLTTANVINSPHMMATNSASLAKAVKETKSISPLELSELIDSHTQVEPLMIDMRSIDLYERSRIRHSIHISVPTLLIKRYRRGVVSNFNLESFITTSEGMERFRAWMKQDKLDNDDKELQPGEIVIYDDHMNDKMAATWTLIGVLQKNAMKVRWLQGGFNGFLAWDTKHEYLIGSEFIRSDTPPLPIPTYSHPMNDMSSSSIAQFHHNREQIPNKLKMPTPMISRSAITLSSSNHTYNQENVQRRASLFNLDTKSMRSKNRPLVSVAQQQQQQQQQRRYQPQKVEYNHHHHHHKIPFSLNEADKNLQTHAASGYSLEKEKEEEKKEEGEEEEEEEEEKFYTPLEQQLSSANDNNDNTPALLIAVNGLNDSNHHHNLTITPKTENEYDFVVSEIIPHFLYLGPEIATDDQLNDLRDRSIRRILNMAEECEDDIPGLKENFIYTKIAAQDTVEMQNVQGTLKKAVHVIEDSKKHHEPIYVHCKAGKSRSAAAILAYLVLSEHWTLKRAYRHIVKARPNISPNIGFVAELMKLEKDVHGKTSNFAGTDWHFVDLANPPSPETQKEMGRLEKAWKRGSLISNAGSHIDLTTAIKSQQQE